MSVPLSPESEPKFRVAICGAGIGGLVLAITIGKYDPTIPIDIYEAHDSIDTAGVGITLWKQFHDVLIELGLFDNFKQIFTRKSEGPKIRRADMPHGGYLWYERPDAPSSMHRQQMVAILEQRLPASCTVHLKKRLVDFVELEQQDTNSMTPIRLEFADGTTAATGILIGADGIRSAVRKTLFETAASQSNGDDDINLREYIDATFTGMLVYRFLVSAETLERESPGNRALKELTAYHGRGRYLITYPIVQGAIINVGVVIGDPSLAGEHYEGHWVTDATCAEVIDRFDDFEPDARTIVKLCEKPSKWAIHVVKPLPFGVRKKVALIGDACHAMTPHYGGGAVQSIDDAFVLGRLIAHPLTTLSRIPDVLQIYQEIRLPFAQSVARLSVSTGWIYMFMHPQYYDGTRKEEDLDERGISAYEKEGMESVKQEILRRWEWIDDSKGAVQAWQEAELKLQVLAGRTTN